jgi:hypothetical protein
MPRKRPGLGHRRPVPTVASRRERRLLPSEPPAVRQWREWLTHQYEPGYWVGRRIPPFLVRHRRGSWLRNGVRWALAIPMLALIASSWLILVAGLLRTPDDRQPFPRRLASHEMIDFHVVFPCWVPAGLVEHPSVGVSPSDPHTALISYAPRRPSHALGGLVPSRVGLYIEERRDQLGLASLLRLPGTKERVGDIDVIVAPESDDPSIRSVSWVRDGLRFEMGGAGFTTEELLAVVQSMRQSCSRT